MQFIGSLEAAENYISAEIFKENLPNSVKTLQICMVLQDSVDSVQRLQDLHRFAKIENLAIHVASLLSLLFLHPLSSFKPSY